MNHFHIQLIPRYSFENRGSKNFVKPRMEYKEDKGNHLDIFWKICIDMIDTYLSNGYTVEFNYIVNPENIKVLQDKFKKYKIKFIILITDEGTLLSRDKERPKDCQMGERCVTLLNNFKNKNYNKNNFLDTSNLSVDETLEEIEKDNKYFI